MNLTCTLAPVREPITLEEAKSYLHISHDFEDRLLVPLIQAARSHVEGITKRALLKQRWMMTLIPPYPKRFPLVRFTEKELEVTLPLPPLLNIEGVRVKGEEVSYQQQMGKVQLSDQCFGRLIQIDFWAGYGDDPESLPPPLKVAVFTVLRSLYDGETVSDIPLLHPYKVFSFV